MSVKFYLTALACVCGVAVVAAIMSYPIHKEQLKEEYEKNPKKFVDKYKRRYIKLN